MSKSGSTLGPYVRKSNDQHDRSEDVKSVATQKDLVTAFAASRGWALDEKYVFSDDGITGALFAERPGLQAPLAATRTTPVPFMKLIVVEQSRLGRTSRRSPATRTPHISPRSTSNDRTSRCG